MTGVGAHVRGFRFDGVSWQVVVDRDRDTDPERRPQQPAADLPRAIREALQVWLEDTADD